MDNLLPDVKVPCRHYGSNWDSRSECRNCISHRFIPDRPWRAKLVKCGIGLIRIGPRLIRFATFAWSVLPISLYLSILYKYGTISPGILFIFIDFEHIRTPLAYFRSPSRWISDKRRDACSTLWSAYLESDMNWRGKPIHAGLCLLAMFSLLPPLFIRCSPQNWTKLKNPVYPR